jgi:hypothetical protein
MSLISFTALQDGVTGVNAAATNNPLNTIFNDYNGNITDANIATNAGIAGSKISFASISIPVKFRVYRNASYNSVSATFTRMPYDTKNFDTGTNVDVVTNQGRFTAPVGGYYHFTARYGTSGASSNIDYITLYKNGTEFSRGNVLQYTANPMGLIVTDFVQLSAGDYVEVFYSINSVAVVDVGSPFNYFSGVLLGS